MRNENQWKKGLVFGIILLFVGMSVVPTIRAYNVDSEAINRNRNITRIETTSFGSSPNASGGSISLGYQYVTIYENDVYGIDVGDTGATVTIYVNYNMSCIGTLDEGWCNISFVDGGDSDEEYTGGVESGILSIEKFFFPGQFFSVQLFGRYHDAWGNVWIEETNYSFFSTNAPPKPPRINGPLSGKVGEFYTYTFVAEDSDGDDIFYEIGWGEGGMATPEGPFPSNVVITREHKWTEEGIFIIQARAIDVYGHKGGWGYFNVTMPLDLISSYKLFLKQINQSPNEFQQLKQLLIR
jgi:hypothetical protein